MSSAARRRPNRRPHTTAPAAGPSGDSARAESARPSGEQGGQQRSQQGGQQSENKSGGDAANNGGKPGGQSRRRRRGKKSRGGRNQSAPSAAKTSSQSAGGEDAATKSSGKPHGSKPHGSKAQSAKTGGKSNEGQGKGNRRRASGTDRRRGKADARPRTRSTGTRRDLSDHLPVNVETSAGGLALAGLDHAIASDGTVDLNEVHVALIGRLDRRGRVLWSMPKGHVEPGEAHDVTAQREVWEETGFECEVIAELGTIDYWFISEGQRIHKTVHHHLLKYLDGDPNVDDPEVTEIKWVRLTQVVNQLAYSDERRLARQAQNALLTWARKSHPVSAPSTSSGQFSPSNMPAHLAVANPVPATLARPNTSEDPETEAASAESVTTPTPSSKPTPSPTPDSTRSPDSTPETPSSKPTPRPGPRPRPKPGATHSSPSRRQRPRR